MRARDLGAHDLGKKNDGSFGSSIEPLMAIDYAIGVGSFRPNNAIVFMDKAVELMTRLMKEKGIKHTTSECTLRGFTCADVDPTGASPGRNRKDPSGSKPDRGRGHYRRSGNRESGCEEVNETYSGPSRALRI